MSDSRPIVTADNNNEGQVIVDWAQVPDDDIRYDTNDEEALMRAKAKERKRQKVAEQAWQEEQAQLEAERVAREQAKAKRAEREKAKAKRIAWEAEEQRACEGVERHRAEEEKEAERKHRAEAGKGSEAGGKCCWPRDGKDAKASPKAIKGKKRKVNEENAEARPSMQKQARMSMRATEVLDLDKPEASGSGVRKATNNLAGLFELQEAAVEHSGCIANALESLLDESYGFRMAVSPSDLGSSELDSDELCEEAKWLKTHGEDREEETKGEDEAMAKAE
ncbi:hypothetical protein M404DRAFT_22759 [Pisolithus tinctorius Marx 270]|uniref:Uncharacterized protein n=1 Tax=Pisolithus tinctorius Marx 270 TaxID=870435 RepID=A0A0C3PKZ8_PISTI|nr:hypothetical protein M404DRAFT_22759 [Pisolithus tinctorius Marx 270]